MNLFDKIKKIKPGKKVSTNTEAGFISVIFFGIIPFFFIVYLLLAPLIKIIKKDFSSETMMTISEKLRIRSDKDKNSYVIGSYPFGTEVKVYQIFDNNWAEVSVGNKKGYMSFEYLVLPETFYTIQGMFGNEYAQKLISSTRYRKAIASYLKKNNYTTKIPESEREKLYGKKSDKEIWQVFAESPKSEFNSFCYGDYNGDGKQDAAFIITNIKTGERRLIILKIDTDIPGEYGELTGSEILKEDYLFIKNIPKGTKMFLSDTVKQKIETDAVLIGTNRNKSFGDVDTLMLYNGKTFSFFPQSKK